MNLCLTFVFLLTFFVSPGTLLAEIVFRCSSCTAENMVGCPKVDAGCTEIVREPGCGCCPVCARMEGEFCGVYTPRCSSGLICYPSMDADLPLQQLIQGFGRCVQQSDEGAIIGLEHQATNGESQKLWQILLSGVNRMNNTRSKNLSHLKHSKICIILIFFFYFLTPQFWQRKHVYVNGKYMYIYTYKILKQFRFWMLIV